LEPRWRSEKRRKYTPAIPSLRRSSERSKSFGTGQGISWDQHDKRLFSGSAAFYRNGYRSHLVSEWLPALEGVEEKAEAQWERVKVKFVEKNKCGVLDHDVTLPSGLKAYNPMRIFPNNDGSEFGFTLYHRPDMSDQEFAEDPSP
jgi:hypothetical protein